MKLTITYLLVVEGLRSKEINNKNLEKNTLAKTTQIL